MNWFDKFRKTAPKKRVTVPDAEADMPTISARVPRVVKDWIREQGRAEDVPMSAIVRLIVEAAYRLAHDKDRDVWADVEGTVPFDPQNPEHKVRRVDPGTSE